MAESFSLKNLFTAGLTREQFLSKYNELKQNVTEATSSIFGKNMENSIAQIYDTLNTDGNETLDQSEIDTLIAMSTEDGDNVLSESDMKVLYQKMASEIAAKYPAGAPDEMYNQAMQGVDDIYSSSYIQDLTTQIHVLHQLKSQRQSNSTGLIRGFQSQIDDLVLKSKSLSLEFKAKYKETSDQVTKLKKEAAQNNAELQRLEQEKHDIESEKRVIQKEIENLDPEKDKDKIESRKSEISAVDRRLAGVNDAQNAIKSTIAANEIKYNKSNSELEKLTKQAQEQDSSISSNVQALKGKIQAEEDSLKADLADYDNQINILTQAQEYAITQIKEQPLQDASSADSHKNDNLMSFDELSKSGLKYSGEKGQKLAQSVRSHLKGFTGYCSRHVSNALAESGLGHERAASAHMMDSQLANNSNFKEITISSADDLKRLPAGCVLVYEAGAAGYNAQHGHIEVTLGDGTAGSDGVTRNLRYTQNMHVFVPVDNA